MLVLQEPQDNQALEAMLDPRVQQVSQVSQDHKDQLDKEDFLEILASQALMGNQATQDQ